MSTGTSKPTSDISPGWHTLTVTGVYDSDQEGKKYSTPSGKDYVKVQLASDRHGGGSSFKSNFFLTEKARWRIDKFCEVTNLADDAELTDAVGQSFRGKIEINGDGWPDLAFMSKAFPPKDATTQLADAGIPDEVSGQTGGDASDPEVDEEVPF